MLPVMRLGVLLLTVGSACASVRPPPLGLRADQSAVAKAERQAKQAAEVRSAAAAIAGIAGGVGGVVLLGSQLQPVSVAPGATDPSLAGFQTEAQRLQQLSMDNKTRDRTIAASILLGAAGVFLGACVVSAVIDDGASEWLAIQRQREQQDLTPTEADANRELLAAAREAQKVPAPPGRTLRPGQKRRSTAIEALPLLP
jgi:hypothetical protein